LAKEFIANPTDNPKLSEKEVKSIAGLGDRMVSKGVISLQNDRATSYSMYITVQNELMAAFNELRDELAMQLYGRKTAQLFDEEADVIKAVYPSRISEAEPKNIGGK
jgi:hypothetical protein